MNRAQVTIVLAFLAGTPLLGQTAAPPLRLVQELRIDGAAQDLSGVGAVTIRPGGGIVLVEPQDFRLRFYDGAGKEIGRFGRQGQGPEEFGARPAPAGQRVNADIALGSVADTTWAYDRALRRFMLLSKDGRFIGTVAQPDRLPSFAGGAQAQSGTQRTLLSFDARAMFGDGSMLGRVTWGRVDAAATRAQNVETGYAMSSPRGDITRVVAQIPTRPEFVVSRNAGAAIPFVERVYESIAHDGSRIALGFTTISSANNGTLRILVISARGDTLVARDHPFAAIPLSNATRDSALADRMRSFRGSVDEADLESKLRAGMPRAASPYRGMTIGADYSLWIVSPLGPRGREYLVLNDAGTPYGRVSLPANARLVSMTRTMVWAVELDANDLPSLVRYRVAR